ncbi:hypothetical protein A3D80_00975 [Candidatus Roizmanbacteria bacterium RIFCSPHIGHO2_02_FULL_40_13b]|uniref:HTH cro/C1-type domain-containing protein n=1 Tax=Candidatus Roizmanbacteria bacterium RIFCSPHIGHO2_01_FULL_39_24 TaxID=1802032 RepID=A0A1F7GJ21_9BACT|nr:MAG: hypothetical protein A2799_02340 [Candidatus Roizmanbacteria bacterium RIFCSPHIGHO2_01_FULL_39_24]OGK26268.1 MAG: hypothetical protein A3D80_00975 [Candidatus Roizmanbacteria bacterium RIFCSPHIGHO2_02_FULL_40_13b]OGK48903.1 MAG: hypothetical protein A3A56_01735 [Candidatus Roizmanbacteria bacterium RIFCSPLOWO2_01_FULL_40_32]OGK57570.1 MAG: hypothetical protein A3H83_01970 [Candidatus Roizmanbacteria bacterium RIFCSPLOWO2_02_FULL_39_8]
MRNRQSYTFREDLAKRLKDPTFKKAWEESEAEYLLAKRMIEVRLMKKLTQRELAQRVKTSQTQIARIETMSANPSLHTLKRIAKALDTKLILNFK